MKPLDGIELPSFPIPELRHVRDLVYYDGPLLAHYESPQGDDYLYYWCDCDAKANRWMVLRVTEASILRLVNRYVPLDFVIPKECRDGFVFLIDIADNGRVGPTFIVSPDKIPQDYKPRPGTYLQVTRNLHSDTTYSVLVEGGWSVENLGDFPNTFGKAYALLYGLNVLHTDFESHPWRGNFSAMHFFNRASRRIPAEHKPNVAAISYFSPGFMRFNLHGQTASQVTQCIVEYKAKNAIFAEAYGTLTKYLREQGLSREDLNLDEVDWSVHNGPLRNMTIVLLKEFTSISETDFLRACPRPFEAAKIAKTFYNFIQKLAQFEKLGQVLYPKLDHVDATAGEQKLEPLC